MRIGSGDSPVERFLQGYSRRRYAILFFSLLSSFVILPILGLFRLGSTLAEIYLSVTLVTAVTPILKSGLRRVLLIVLVASWLGNITGIYFIQKEVALTGLGLATIVALIAAANGLKFALSGSQVGREHLYAALSAYLLAGIFLGHFYWILERAWPGSMLVSGTAGQRDFSVSSGVYFSFITLSTLGYGDIVPYSQIARGVAVIEAVAGQLYLAVMVARLVGIYRNPSGEN